MEPNKNIITEYISLAVLKRASDPTNYHILQNLPNTIPILMEDIKISKMPFYKRLNELEEVGLVNWRRGTGQIEGTEITDYVLKSFQEMNKHVEEAMPEILKGKYG